MPDSFAAIAIPLRRPSIIDFLEAREPTPRGASLRILAQRPSAAAQSAWADHLRSQPVPTTSDLLAIADPHAYLTPTHTDRLVPEQFLQEPGFLTRNLGGWSPVYFGVAEIPKPLPDDPLFDHLEVLTTYGSTIQSFGADPQQVEQRLPDEMGGGPRYVSASVGRLDEVHAAHMDAPKTYVRVLHEALAETTPLQTSTGHPVPRLLLCDALMDHLVTVERDRRAAHARHDTDTMDRLQQLLDQWETSLGLRLLLKGEYIAGRHRRSTILIAEDLDLVIKQPAPEPFHDIEMDARTVDGEPENWPYLTRDGSVVMPQGRVRLVLEDNVVPRLHDAFDHGVQFSSLLGLIVEEYVEGPTLQEWVQADPERMTQELYERVAATQQVCEHLNVVNPDWHSANFIVQPDGSLVHIDWGAARPLHNDERTDSLRRARRDKVKNLAYSFHDDAIAERVDALHETFMTDDAMQARVRRRAEALLD